MRDRPPAASARAAAGPAGPPDPHPAAAAATDAGPSQAAQTDVDHLYTPARLIIVFSEVTGANTTWHYRTTFTDGTVVVGGPYTRKDSAVRGLERWAARGYPRP